MWWYRWLVHPTETFWKSGYLAGVGKKKFMCGLVSVEGKVIHWITLICNMCHRSQSTGTLVKYEHIILQVKFRWLWMIDKIKEQDGVGGDLLVTSGTFPDNMTKYILRLSRMNQPHTAISVLNGVLWYLWDWSIELAHEKHFLINYENTRVSSPTPPQPPPIRSHSQPQL